VFALNPKCVAFSFMCMGLLLARPTFTGPLTAGAALLSVFVAAYVSMGWYDYYYGCSISPLRRGSQSATGVLKPPPHAPAKQHLSVAASYGEKDVSVAASYGEKDVSVAKGAVYLLHLVLIAPFLGYVAYMGRGSSKRVFWLLGALAVATAAYHGVAAAELV